MFKSVNWNYQDVMLIYLLSLLPSVIAEDSPASAAVSVSLKWVKVPNLSLSIAAPLCPHFKRFPLLSKTERDLQTVLCFGFNPLTSCLFSCLSNTVPADCFVFPCRVYVSSQKYHRPLKREDIHSCEILVQGSE